MHAHLGVKSYQEYIISQNLMAEGKGPQRREERIRIVIMWVAA